ncbi:hypothetical protein HS7_11760 [Sulfolobales archaeon HS-7]|nr:hypothetical protein HS7_11760 [Sulfolobales archaeon HS-7]
MLNKFVRVTLDDYLEFVSNTKKIRIGNEEIELTPVKVRRTAPTAEELTDVTTTVWSFPKRGGWATHRGNYRGNFAPQIPRAVISRYSREGETVLDPMVGSGTTCIEAKLLGRKCIGVDVNYKSVMLSLHRLYWLEQSVLTGDVKMNSQELERFAKAQVEFYVGNAGELSWIDDESIDLVITHPPYFNIIKYGTENPHDLSQARNLKEYLLGLRSVGEEIYRVMKRGKAFGILIGDTREKKHYVPITAYVLMEMLSLGYVLREEIVKVQHKMKTTREIWSKRERDFLLIYHEKLYILEKSEDSGEYKNSSGIFLKSLKELI